MEPIFAVTNKDGSKVTIRENQISEVRTIEIAGDCTENEESIIQGGRQIESINFQSKENTRIYKNNIKNIIKFVDK